MHRTIHWFRRDLRLTDNQALTHAVSLGEILPIFIDTNNSTGSLSKIWLHYSLESLNQSLGGKLQVFSGNPVDILVELSRKYEISQITWNRCYEKSLVDSDILIKNALENQGIVVNIFNSSLLWEPWEITKNDGTPYKVFTAFYRKGCLLAREPRFPIAKPANIQYLDISNNTNISSLGLLPQKDWYKSVVANWEIGEVCAIKRLKSFVNENIHNYKVGRDYPAKNWTSRLSPYLHFGEISPNMAWYMATTADFNDNVDCFMSELGWREFSYHLLYYFPNLDKENWQTKFDKFNWRFDADNLLAWQKGKTGIPIVDAGMRELWQTGYMHNRVRMIVASFLTKNLLIDWRYGLKWFWNTLFDADLANNSASWQWVAGCGADAAPYFRIFNPVTQSEKFDPDGGYIRKYVPEIRNLPNKYLYKPWLAPEDVLQTAKVRLGEDYPNPIVDLNLSRQIALSRFKSLSEK